MSQTLGWIGLGAMGTPMATNLLQAGFPLTVYNRTAEKGKALAEKGAQIAASPHELVAAADIIFLMLTNGDAIHEVLTQEDGVLSGITTGKVVIDMSTISPAESSQFAHLVAEKGGRYIDVPVSGSVGAAQSAQLVLLAGSTEADAASFSTIFAALGKKTVYFREQSKGSSAKLAINQLLALTGQAVAETLLFTERAGLHQEDVFEMISNSGMNTGMFQTKKDMYRSQSFPSAFMLELMNKDLGLITHETELLQLSLPLTQTARTTYLAAREHGKAQMDMAAVYLELKEQNNA